MPCRPLPPPTPRITPFARRLKSRGNFGVAESLFTTATHNGAVRSERKIERGHSAQSVRGEGEREVEIRQRNSTQRASPLPPTSRRRCIISCKCGPPHLKIRGWVRSISDIISCGIMRPFRTYVHGDSRRRRRPASCKLTKFGNAQL